MSLRSTAATWQLACASSAGLPEAAGCAAAAVVALGGHGRHFRLAGRFRERPGDSSEHPGSQGAPCACPELHDGVRAVKADPTAWRPALDFVAEEAWQRLETLLTRLVEENATVLSAPRWARCESRQAASVTKSTPSTGRWSCFFPVLLGSTKAHHCSASQKYGRACRALFCVGRDPPVRPQLCGAPRHAPLRKLHSTGSSPNWADCLRATMTRLN